MKKKRRVGLILGGIVFLLIGTSAIVSAITAETLPNNNTRVPSSYVFRTGYGNATWELNSAYSGTIGVSDTRSQAGYVSFYVTRYTGSSRTFTNPVTVTFTNAGYINGRAVNIEMNVDRLIQYGGSSTVANNSGEFITLYYTSANVSSWKLNGSGRYRLTHAVDLSYTATYADTGEVVDFPFFQAATDLDTFQNVSTIAEGVVPLSGYTKAYLYPGTQLKQQSGGFFAPGQMDWGGDDSIVKGGVYLVTQNGKFSARHYANNCRTGLQVYNQYKEGTLPKPTLSVDNSHPYKEGDEVILNVNQKIGTMFVDTFNLYSNLHISNVIPQGLTYKSAKVVDSSGSDITEQGKLTFDEGTKEVKFEFDSNFVSNQSNYDGSTYTLQITTTADPIEGTASSITDMGASSISTIVQDTNEAQITVVAPELSVQKVNTGKKYYTGETASYEVTFGQTIEGAEAEDVVVSDALPTGLTLDKDSIKIEGLTEEQYNLKTSDNSYSINIDTLPFGEYTVAYDAKITAEDIDQVLTNTVNISSTNADGSNSSSDLTILEIPKFMAAYSFESADKDIPLPQEVIELLPVDDTEYIKGNTVTAKVPEKTTVDVGTGKWEFEGWNEDSFVIDAANVIFTGVWKYTEYPAPLTLSKTHEDSTYYDKDKIEFCLDFSQDLKGIDAENAVLKDTLPEGLTLDQDSIEVVGFTQDQYTVESTTNGFTIKIPSMEHGIYRVSYTAIANTGREKTELTNTAALTADNAREDKEATDTVNISGQAMADYEFVNADGGELPDEVMELLPKDDRWYKDGEIISAKVLEKTTVTTVSGRWDFKGWDKEKYTAKGEDITFTGIWELTEPMLSIDKSHEDKTYYRGDRVDYEVKIKQETDKAYAVNVVLADKLPKEQELIENSIEIEGLSAGEYEVTFTDEGFGVHIEKLSTGEYILKYSCEIDAEDKDAEFTNIVGIKADNVDGTLKAEDVLKVSEIPKYLRYTFVTENGRGIPPEVEKLLPIDENIYYDGQTVTPQNISTLKVHTAGGTWEFIGWDKTQDVFSGSDILFTGTWKFTADVPITGDNTFPYIALSLLVISSAGVFYFRYTDKKY